MKKTIIIATVSACFVAASSVQAALNLVSDPGFNSGETGVLTAMSTPWFNPGYIPGNPNIDFPNVSIVANAAAPSGWNAVLQPLASENAVLLQSISGLQGSTGYTINFSLATPSENGGSLDVTLGGKDAGTMAVSGNMVWTQYDITVTTATPGVLEFLWIGNAPNTPLEIDNVGVAVPEPTTMVAGALMLLPFAASTLRLRKKAKA
jgi:hypothetical protein